MCEKSFFYVKNVDLALDYVRVPTFADTPPTNLNWTMNVEGDDLGWMLDRVHELKVQRGANGCGSSGGLHRPSGVAATGPSALDVRSAGPAGPLSTDHR
uniref:Predicted protein n=1 Tax=Hordeum vulgare subsp. vulgare TaxID=112509 RepID=F2D2Y7_HORVV|nr:predicted protein [Hordeum vulgare subsp. vulgare]